MDPDADRRFLRLAAAVAAAADPEDVPGLDVDVRGRTFAHRTRDADGRAVDVRVAVLPSALVVRPGLGAIASEAWGVELSDEEAWFRLTLVAWDEGLGTTEDVGSGWWTFDGSTVVPVPPWEARGWTPPPEDPPRRDRDAVAAVADRQEARLPTSRAPCARRPLCATKWPPTLHRRPPWRTR